MNNFDCQHKTNVHFKLVSEVIINGHTLTQHVKIQREN